MDEEPLSSLIQTQHPQLADEVKNAINVMEKVLRIAHPAQVGGGGKDTSDDVQNLQTQDISVSDLLATADSQSFATDRPRNVSPAAPELAAGEAFGRYQIVNMLGKGAMGAVYLAYDPRLERHVAIKIPFVRDDSIALERFYVEARATATLRSPNICPVFDVADINGVHFISMAFIEGKPLTKLIDESPLAPQDAATLLSKAARGIQKAHERGVVHRDIKPDNIMIDSDGEPVVMDFGLAVRHDSEDARLTSDGSLLGSPAYMSPEQAKGKVELIGPATDIYSLGVVLYQMLTQEIPFKGSIMKVLRKIVDEKAAPPSQHRPELAGTPIEQMCLKMMEKSPSDRYACMSDVAQAADELILMDSSDKSAQSKRRFTLWPFNRS